MGCVAGTRAKVSMRRECRGAGALAEMSGRGGGDVHGVAPGALDVHEEGVGALYQPLELVLLGLNGRVRVQKISFQRRHIGGRRRGTWECALPTNVQSRWRGCRRNDATQCGLPSRLGRIYFGSACQRRRRHRRWHCGVVRDYFPLIFGLLTRGGQLKNLITIGGIVHLNCAGIRF